MVYVTHDQEEALTLSDRIAVFNNGKVEHVGTPEEIYNQSKTEFVCTFIGDANRLDSKMIREINNAKPPIDSEKISYIRTEKIKTIKPENDHNYKKMTAEVISKEFYGTYSRYTYKVGESSFITNIEKEDGEVQFHIGDKINLYIHPQDILQYPGEKDV